MLTNIALPPFLPHSFSNAVSGGMMPTEWTDVGSAGAWIVMLILFWMDSAWIERRTLVKRLPNCEASQISTAVVRGKLASYSLFILLGVISLSTAITDLPNQKKRFKALQKHCKQ